MHIPYLPVSHDGTRIDNRWVSFSNKEGNQIKIIGSKFAFDAHRFSVEDAWNALHEKDINKRDHIYVVIDGKHGPIGGDIGWFSDVDSEKLVSVGKHKWEFLLCIE